MIQHERFKLILFTLYTILFECLIWGLFLYLIVVQHWNEWTIIVAMLMSSSQLKPKHFGLKYKLEEGYKETK